MLRLNKFFSSSLKLYSLILLSETQLPASSELSQPQGENLEYMNHGHLNGLEFHIKLVITRYMRRSSMIKDSR